jgi:hypothetical protein
VINGWKLQLARASGLAVLATGLTVVAAQPATADVPDWLHNVERVSASTTASAAGRRTVSVDCPGTKVVVGTGYSISASREVLIEDLIPDRDSVTAVAREDETGYATNWSLTVHAVCATEPPGYTVERTLDPNYNSSPESITSATCPEDTVALGLGFALTDTSGQTTISAAIPEDTRAWVMAEEHQLASESDGFTGAWSLDTYVICSEEPIGWYRTSSSNQTTYPRTHETAQCPTGKMAISVGADVDDNERFGSVTVRSLGTGTYEGIDSAAAGAGEDEDGNADDWEFTTHATCVDYAPLD